MSKDNSDYKKTLQEPKTSGNSNTKLRPLTDKPPGSSSNSGKQNNNKNKK